MVEMYTTPFEDQDREKSVELEEVPGMPAYRIGKNERYKHLEWHPRIKELVIKSLQNFSEETGVVIPTDVVLSDRHSANENGTISFTHSEDGGYRNSYLEYKGIKPAIDLDRIMNEQGGKWTEEDRRQEEIGEKEVIKELPESFLYAKISRKIIHEMGHIAEGSFPEIHEKCMEYINKHKNGSIIEYLDGDIFVQPLDNQLLREHQTTVYKNDKGEVKATEILSVGLEYYMANRKRLEKVDHDLYELVKDSIKVIKDAGFNTENKELYKS